MRRGLKDTERKVYTSFKDDLRVYPLCILILFECMWLHPHSSSAGRLLSIRALKPLIGFPNLASMAQYSTITCKIFVHLVDLWGPIQERTSVWWGWKSCCGHWEGVILVLPFCPMDMLSLVLADVGLTETFNWFLLSLVMALENSIALTMSLFRTLFVRYIIVLQWAPKL